MGEIILSNNTSIEAINYTRDDPQVQISVTFEDFKDRYQSWGPSTPLDAKAVKNFNLDLGFLNGASLANAPIVINEFEYRILGVEWKALGIDIFIELSDEDLVLAEETTFDIPEGPLYALSTITATRTTKLFIERSFGVILNPVSPLARLLNNVLIFIGLKQKPRISKVSLISGSQESTLPPAHNRQHIIQISNDSEYLPSEGKRFHRGFGQDVSGDNAENSYFLLSEQQRNLLHFLIQDKVDLDNSNAFITVYQNPTTVDNEYIGSFHFKDLQFSAIPVTGGIVEPHNLTEGVFLPHIH